MFLLFLTFIFAIQCSDAITATEKNFNKILDSKLPSFVKFYAPWCGHCKSLAPAWEKAATSLKGLVNVVKVDCTVEQNLCQKFQVQGYPTLKLFKNKGKQVKDYQQGRDLSSLVKYATSEIDDKSVKIKSDVDLTKFLDKSAELPHVILFSEKTVVAPLYKALSSVFDGSLVFGVVTNKVKSVVEKYGPIEKFPHILVISSEKGVVRHTGDIALEPLKTFLSEFGKAEDINTASKKTTPKQKEDAKPTPTKPVTPPPAWKDGRAEDFDLEEVCKQKNCVLALVNYEGDVVVPAEKVVLDEVLTKFHKGNKFTFVVAPFSNPKFSEKFSFKESTLLIYNAKKQKIAKASSFETTSAIKLLDSALGGDLTYTTL